MTRAWLIILAAILVVLLVWLGIVVRKVNAVPGGREASKPAVRNADGPAGIDLGACVATATLPFPAVESGPKGTAAIGSVSDADGGLVDNRTGRAADGEIPSALPRKAEDVNQSQARLARLFDAIRQVESGGDDRAVGDGGRSCGPYQCGRAAWADGGGNPKDYDRLVWNRAACEKVMRGYWKRYGATTDEQRARTWNGGPNGMQKKATLAYWHKVKEGGA